MYNFHNNIETCKFQPVTPIMRFTYNIIFGLKHFVNIHFLKNGIFFLSTTIFVYCKGRIKNLHFIFTSYLFLFGADFGFYCNNKIPISSHNKPRGWRTIKHHKMFAQHTRPHNNVLKNGPIFWSLIVKNSFPLELILNLRYSH